MLFYSGTRINLREFLDRYGLDQETYLYDAYSFVASLIIMLVLHCTLYLIQNE